MGKMLRAKKLARFNALTEPEARYDLARWKLVNPSATLTDVRVFRGPPMKPSAFDHPKASPTVTVVIQYQE